jgi:ABC-type uncharacterized transport system substrate-binding protein
MPVVGFLRSTPLNSSTSLVAAFRQGLKEFGFNEGQNVTVEFRFADNQIDRLPGLVDELVRHPVNVITTNVLGALAAKNATTAVPIVFVTGSDPVKDGLVASLNRPGGNITGVSFVSSAQLPLMIARAKIRRAQQDKNPYCREHSESNTECHLLTHELCCQSLPQPSRAPFLSARAAPR